ncbi:hypothetical protein CJD36_022465 [Flavipsychrobacter stenotrophus]|uniref:Histidine kinase n=1 Tax=Flavipsychrobacter stenotrophus TaxID=2077091 RepID=A0A2S7SQD2_9BACT|nr:two-component regulator propeller domain-containing protein [Flavipsychrobacter stenotrophus]PQJ08766.1 hypothetical protein CJD36_022465 [Flavipsychrobacter stenotrophus]
MKRISSLLLLLILGSVCNGQDQSQPKRTPRKIKTNTTAHPKMVRAQGTSYTQVDCGFMDKTGKLWFGTLNAGVYCYDGTSFTNFTKKDGLLSNNVNAIVEDKAGDILFGTSNGICRYSGKTITNLTAKEDASKSPVSCLLEDKQGNLWFGTMNSGIYRYDGKKFTNFLNNDDHPFNLGVHYQYIVHIIQDKMGNLWFSSWNGGGVWRYDGKSFKNFLPSTEYYRLNEDQRSSDRHKTESMPNFIPIAFTDSRPKDCIHDDMIFSICEDKPGNLWFATRRHGACRYDGKSFTGFREQEGFVSGGIYFILEDKHGNIWLTTESNGVWCYDGKTFRNLTTKDGLINNSVWFALEDKKGNLWFGTRGFGLSRFDGKTFTTFSEYSE